MRAVSAIRALYAHNREYFPYISGKMLSWTCHDMHAAIPACAASFKDIVYRKLSERLTEEQTSTLLALVRDYPAVISGSFILACIYGENWYDDVDIYEDVTATYTCLNHAYNRDLEKLVKAVMVKTDQLRFNLEDLTKVRDVMLRIAQGNFNQGWEQKVDVEETLKSYLGFSPISKFLYKQLISAIDYRGLMDTNVIIPINAFRRIRTFTVGPGQQKIQHIPVDTCAMGVIACSFDADILKNVYDGTHLRVWDWKILLARKDVVKPNGLMFNGYTESDENSLNIVRERSEKRAEKYSQRGVTLTMHPDYDALYSALMNAKN